MRKIIYLLIICICSKIIESSIFQLPDLEVKKNNTIRLLAFKTLLTDKILSKQETLTQSDYKELNWVSIGRPTLTKKEIDLNTFNFYSYNDADFSVYFTMLSPQDKIEFQKVVLNIILLYLSKHRNIH